MQTQLHHPALPRHGVDRAALRARLALLRQKLRHVLAERKARTKEIGALARKERVALRAELRELRAKALRELAGKMRAAHDAAKAARAARLEQVKLTYTNAVAAARARFEVEAQHQAEHQRIGAEEQRRRVEIDKTHARMISDDTVRSAATLGHFGPLFERMAVKPVPGESKTEAVLRHVEQRPELAHAVLEPAKEAVIVKTRAEIAAVEHAARSAPKAPSARASKPKLTLIQGSGASASATVAKLAPAAERYGVHYVDAAKGREGWVRHPSEGTPVWIFSRADAEARARGLGGSSGGTKYEARPYTGPVESIRYAVPAPEKKVKAPELKDTAQIAARIREDLKQAVRAKRLPDAKYSVTTDRYSMGSSIDVTVSRLPFRILNSSAYRIEKGSSHVSFDRDHFRSRYTTDAETFLEQLNAVIDAYHWDRSDPVTDYYNERFGKHVTLGDESKEYDAIDAAARGEKPKPSTEASGERPRNDRTTKARTRKPSPAKKRPTKKRAPPAKRSAKAVSRAPAPAATWMPAGYSDRVLCARCGCKGEQHRVSDGKCPATSGFGHMKALPSGLDGKKLDAALKAYWSGSATSYRAIRT